MEFSRPEYWSELPFFFPGDRPLPEVKPGSQGIQRQSRSKLPLQGHDPALHCRQILYYLSHQDSSSLKTVLGIRNSSSVQLSCVRLCDPMDCSTPGFPVHHQLLELSQTHVHRISDAIQPAYWALTNLGSSSFILFAFSYCSWGSPGKNPEMV